MTGRPDAESGITNEAHESDHCEAEALLPITRSDVETSDSPTKLKAHFYARPCVEPKHRILPTTTGFFLGIVACLLAQYAIYGSGCFRKHEQQPTSIYRRANQELVTVLASSWAGSTQVHNYPPTKPTNAYPSLFPSNVGHAGKTPTGAEPAVIETAPSYPLHTGQCTHDLLRPVSLEGDGSRQNLNDDGSDVKKGKKPKFNLFHSWGNLSPWYSIERGRFGVDSSPSAPDTCQITGLHFLHRHGARYPSQGSYGGPAKFATKLHENPESWTASGSLDFLNDWTYKLGEEVLTPFGRQQLYDLGVSLRMKYGFLLQNFTEKNAIPVFRTESQDRMLASAMNFAIGFFGYPFDGQYQQSIIIEDFGFNNTLAPYMTCLNALIPTKGDRGLWYLERWANIYLKHAHKRLKKQMHGLNLTIEDVHTMQQMCAYETVALGYSKFCELFTEKEWEGFDYAIDLTFWYGFGFGSPVARAQGIGYVQELVSRLTHTRIETHNSSTNATLNDNPITFPLDQSLYVDATHDAVVLTIITALNLTTFAASGPLPYTHIDHHRSFRVSELAPFATNIQFQLLECTSLPGPQIRIIINDAVVPLTGIKGCPKQKDGMCPVDTFVRAQKETIAETDWSWDCLGDWKVPNGTEWETVTGQPPKKV